MQKLPCVVLFVILAGCSAVGSDSDDVEITVGVDAIQATNNTSGRLYYEIIAERRLPYYTQPPSLNQESSIEAGATRSIPVESFSGGSNEKQYVFLWWHAVLRNGQPTPGDRNEVDFTLP